MNDRFPVRERLRKTNQAPTSPHLYGANRRPQPSVPRAKPPRNSEYFGTFRKWSSRTAGDQVCLDDLLPTSPHFLEVA